jgi:phospholipid N-methyltransferase
MKTTTGVSRLKYTLQFMKGVIVNNAVTGAIGPSTRALAEAVTDLAEVRNAKVIVEYGAGTGVFTEVILEKMPKDALLLALEVNPEFVRSTQERCPRAWVVEDTAQNARLYLERKGFSHCDTIVSGLPWTRFSEALQDEILEATYHVLRPGGLFVTFGYAFSPWVPSGRRFFKGKLLRRFPEVHKVGPIWKNFPPANVYIARKNS